MIIKPQQSLIHTIGSSQVDYHVYQGPALDKLLSAIMILIMSPFMIINMLISLVTRRSIFTTLYKTDALGHPLSLRHFTCGIFKKSGMLINIFSGKLSFCGAPLTHRLTPQVQARINNRYICKAGIFSLFDLHQRTGLAINDPEKLLLVQLNSNTVEYVLLLIKSLLCFCLYSNSKQTRLDNKHFPVFGLNINNLSMQEAVNWVTASHTSVNVNKTRTNLGFFINVNSINICFNQAEFHHTLQQADILLADGSGMRLAAQTAGFELKDNTNGTDMLPHLCKRCIEQSKSLYFLGAKPGVAATAASKLKKQFPGLVIAGVQHGFIHPSQHEEQIKLINESGCDILLVAMGSPLQENWLLKHRDQLHCQTALAVGGLFDFYSDKIARSPLWLRELGLEWIWRLSQEPITKFKRYVIGTPLFLFRIYVLRLASKGVK